MSFDAPNKGVELIHELNKSPSLPPYRLQIIQELCERIKDTIRTTSDIYNKVPPHSDPSYQSFVCRLNLHRCLAARWKRYLACYYYERWRRIRNLQWFFGRQMPEQAKQNFSQQEKAGLDDYEKLIQAYTRNSGVEVTSALTPPVVVHVEIDVLENLGTIQTESGSTVFLRGSRQFVRRRDVEHLIRAGSVVELPPHVSQG